MPAATSIATIIRELESIDGGSCFHGARYYSSTADQELARYRTAKALAAACDIERELHLEKLRLFRDGATSCAWCGNGFVELRHTRAIGDRLVHFACGEQFDGWTSGPIELTPEGRAALEGAA